MSDRSGELSNSVMESIGNQGDDSAGGGFGIDDLVKAWKRDVERVKEKDGAKKDGGDPTKKKKEARGTRIAERAVKGTAKRKGDPKSGEVEVHPTDAQPTDAFDLAASAKARAEVKAPPTDAFDLEAHANRLAMTREAEAAEAEAFEPVDAFDLPMVSRKAAPRFRGRRMRPRSKTIAMKRLTRAELHRGALANPPVEGVMRPQTRAECRDTPRPCPWVACKHHLYLDINPRTGSIKINFPDLEPWEMSHTCALDVADSGGLTLEEIGLITNLTRERVRQLEVRGLLTLKGRSGPLR